MLSCRVTLLLGLSQAVAVSIFLHGFLLTRLELPERSRCSDPELSTGTDAQTISLGNGCWSDAAFDRAVIIIIDALRYDFVFGSGSRQGRMPKLTGLLVDAGAAGVAVKFVADTPTITMSRLKAILTGGLPTFLDIGQSFSAAAINEDNLLAQMRDRGMRVVVMGDDTWVQLAPRHEYAACHPYPAFDVRDLHTVDDGVWQHLLPYLRQATASSNNATAGSSDKGDPLEWDVLVAHYLGVDHAGHTYGGESREMYDKLQQMDEQVAAIAEELLAAAGVDGPYSRTLLLALGDHGQTMSGDHGGGSDEERNSVLLALHMGRWREARRAAADAAAAAATAAAAAVRPTANWTTGNPPRDEGKCVATAGGGGGDDDDDDDGEAAAAASAAAVTHVPEPEAVPQIDLTPTLSLLLGLPIPYGNLGRVNRRIWDMAHEDFDRAADGGDGAFAADNTSSRNVTAPTGTAVAAGPAAMAAAAAPSPPSLSNGLVRSSLRGSYMAALRSNAVQVGRYLTSYAARGGLPSAELAHCTRRLRDAHEAFRRLRYHCSFRNSSSSAEGAGYGVVEDTTSSTAEGGGGSSSSGDEAGLGQNEAEAEVVVSLYEAFLEAAGSLARCKFTRFHLPSMGLGCGLMLGCVCLHVWLLAWLGGRWGRELLGPLSCGAATAALVHALGLFSANWIQGEGRIQCYSLAGATLLLWLLGALRRADPTDNADDAEGGGGGGSGDSAEGAAIIAAVTAVTAPSKDTQRAGGCSAVHSHCTSAAVAGGDGCTRHHHHHHDHHHHDGREGGGGGGGCTCGHSAGCEVENKISFPATTTSISTTTAEARHTAVLSKSRGPGCQALSPSSRYLDHLAHWQPQRWASHHHHHHHHHHHPQQQQQQQQRQQQRQQQGFLSCSWRCVLLRQVRLAGMAVAALVCNVALQRYSLIDRWGSDPHDKRQLGGAGVATRVPQADAISIGEGVLGYKWVGLPRRVLLLAALETLVPLGLLPALLAVLRPRGGDAVDAAAAVDAVALQATVEIPVARDTRQRHRPWRRWRWRWWQQLQCSWRRLQWQLLGAAPFQLTAAWWVVQLTGLGDVSLRAVAGLVAAAALAPARMLLVVPLLSPALVLMLQGSASPLLGILRIAARLPAVTRLWKGAVTIWELPLRLLLPRLVYGMACLATLQMLLLAAMKARWWRQRRRRQTEWGAASSSSTAAAQDANGGSGIDALQARSTPGGGRAGQTSGVAMLDATCTAIASFTAVVTLLLGRRGPAIMLLLWGQGLGLFGLLLAVGCPGGRRRRLRVRQEAGTAAELASSSLSVCWCSGPATGVEAAGGALLAALGTQAFFLSGHFCEFSGLHYDSPFVGFDHVTWPATPLLFWINSLGGLMLPALALPLATAAIAAAAVPAAGKAKCATAPPPPGHAQKGYAQHLNKHDHNRVDLRDGGDASRQDLNPAYRPATITPPVTASRPSTRHPPPPPPSPTPPSPPLRGEALGAALDGLSLVDPAIHNAVCGCADNGNADCTWPCHGCRSGDAGPDNSPSLSCHSRSRRCRHSGGLVLLVALSFWRSLSLCVAVLSGAIQRHHVVLWALFAPKLVFEVSFSVATYVGLLVAAAAAAV